MATWTPAMADRARALLAGASERPWHLESDGSSITSDEGRWPVATSGGGDADLIVEAPTLLESALAEIDRLRAVAGLGMLANIPGDASAESDVMSPSSGDSDAVATPNVAENIPGTPDDLDLDLLAKFVSGEGGRRTGALMRAGFIEVKVTPAGMAALGGIHEVLARAPT